jgi:hypothetical protein
VKVLVVDGDPRTSLRASESYYLMNALSPGGPERSPFLPRVILEEELANIDLKPFEALFLLNVARLPVSRLAPFLESGKTVMVFLGDRIDPGAYNNFPHLPWRIGELKDLSHTKPARITEVDHSNVTLKPLLESAEKGLKSASFYRYFRIEGSIKKLLGLENGDPLLVESDLAKGKLFFFASSADLDWNDLPLKAVYLPIIQGFLRESMRLSEGSLPKWARFGEPFPEKTRPIQVMTPKGIAQGGPGIYQFSLAPGQVRRGLNIPLEESDLSKVTDDEMKKKFQNLNIEIIDYHEGAMGAVYGARKEIWPFLLAFLFGILAIEMVIANRI